MTTISSALIIAGNDIRLIFREKNFLIIILIFILMSALSSYIGWASQHILHLVYNSSAAQLLTAGKTVPPFPLTDLSPLYLMKNMIIYVVLIGALLAIIIGHTLSTNDRKAGVTKIIFSKPVTRSSFYLGKIIASSAILLFALGVSMVVSLITIIVISPIHMSTFLDICIFYTSSFLYLAGFSYLAIACGFLTDSSTKGILLPLLFWIVIIFVIPELGSALYPTSSLNPVLPSVTTLDSPILTTIHSFIYPFSISEQYKDFTSGILGVQRAIPASNIVGFPSWLHLVILIFWFIYTLEYLFGEVRGFNAAEGYYE